MSFARFKHLAGTAGHSPVATDVNGVLRKRTPAEARADIETINRAGDTMEGAVFDIPGSGSGGVRTYYKNSAYPGDKKSSMISSGQVSFGSPGNNAQPNMAYICMDTEDRLLFHSLISNFSFYFNKKIDCYSSYSVQGDQVISSRQTGMGATLSAATIGATYNSTVQGQLQAAHDKIRLLEIKLKVHGLIAD